MAGQVIFAKALEFEASQVIFVELCMIKIEQDYVLEARLNFGCNQYDLENELEDPRCVFWSLHFSDFKKRVHSQQVNFASFLAYVVNVATSQANEILRVYNAFDDKKTFIDDNLKDAKRICEMSRLHDPNDIYMTFLGCMIYDLKRKATIITE